MCNKVSQLLLLQFLSAVQEPRSHRKTPLLLTPAAPTLQRSIR